MQSVHTCSEEATGPWIFTRTIFLPLYKTIFRCHMSGRQYTLNIGRNRSSLRFTCTSLPQHNFSKKSQLPLTVATSQAVSPKNLWIQQVNLWGLLALLYPNTKISLKSPCCLSLLLRPRQFVLNNLWQATGYLWGLLAVLYPNPTVSLKSLCCLFLLLW